MSFKDVVRLDRYDADPVLGAFKEDFGPSLKFDLREFIEDSL